jgi:hypothetical protein
MAKAKDMQMLQIGAPELMLPYSKPFPASQRALPSPLWYCCFSHISHCQPRPENQKALDFCRHIHGTGAPRFKPNSGYYLPLQSYFKFFISLIWSLMCLMVQTCNLSIPLFFSHNINVYQYPNFIISHLT